MAAACVGERVDPGGQLGALGDVSGSAADGRVNGSERSHGHTPVHYLPGNRRDFGSHSFERDDAAMSLDRAPRSLPLPASLTGLRISRRGGLLAGDAVWAAAVAVEPGVR